MSLSENPATSTTAFSDTYYTAMLTAYYCLYLTLSRSADSNNRHVSGLTFTSPVTERFHMRQISTHSNIFLCHLIQVNNTLTHAAIFTY